MQAEVKPYLLLLFVVLMGCGPSAEELARREQVRVTQLALIANLQLMIDEYQRTFDDPNNHLSRSAIAEYPTLMSEYRKELEEQRIDYRKKYHKWPEDDPEFYAIQLEHFE